ncbi:ATP-binding protein [Methylobacterium nigriterrae]|uniref:ATP-binding protein n=1 Tax=Methylobacterium nigriterrae TaxID=3127512 RepID=UPI003D675027
MGVSSRSETEAAAIEAAGVAMPTRERALGLGRHLGLSGRLFLITVAFVAVAEILIYVPAVANYRLMWLSDRIAAAQVAAVVLDATPGQAVSDELARRLLAGVGAHAIAVRSNGARRLLAVESVPDEVADMVDLRRDDWWDSIRGSWRTLVAPTDEPIRVVGHGRDGFDLVEILLDEAPLRTAIIDFSIRLLLSSLIIAAAAAGLVFIVLQRVIVEPVRRLAHNITEFADDPESLDRIIAPSRRTDEIGHAETALARMERALAGELREKRRLAELGLAVSKINHELRNLLTTAQLLGDRLEGAADLTVQRVAPRLVATLGRAIRFCEATLAYGRATERHPQRRLTLLAPILADLPDLAGLSNGSRVVIRERVPSGLQICADPEQLSRALTNLVRNAVQALDAAGAGGDEPSVLISASRRGGIGSGAVTILVSDNGPGLPERAKNHLFAPFQGSMRAGGTGLGLAIAAELIELNGGTLCLDDDAPGACFRITVPDWTPAG